MATRTDTWTYLDSDETLQRRELIWGYVRDAPAAPFWGHQEIVTRITVLLYQHVWSAGLGRVCTSPVDVVLNAGRGLVLQPDIVYVSTARADIVRNQVWGAPDLVVEVESQGTRRRDRVWKRRWYLDAGVRECWIVDPLGPTVTVWTRSPAGRATRRRHGPGARLQSAVLPTFTPLVQDLLDVDAV